MKPEPVQKLDIEFAGCRREYLEMADPVGACMAAVLAGGNVLQGPQIPAFEAELALMCERRYAVCVGSGTDALYFALVALGIGPGDEVLAPDLSFIATASAILRTGARPVFVDVDASCNLDLDQAAASVTGKTRAIIYVQLFGGMGDPEALETFGKAHGIAVIEDGAQSFGARFEGRPCGAVGEASVLSFDPMKVLSAPGSGGAVLTDDFETARRVRRLRYHGREENQYLELGFNSQMPSTTAAVLSLKLARHQQWTERRAAVASRFLSTFAGLPMDFPTWPTCVDHVWHKFVLRCDERDALGAWLSARGVPTLVHYPRPFHWEPLFGVQDDERCPVAIAHSARTLSLPIHAHLTSDEVDHIVTSVAAFFDRPA